MSHLKIIKCENCGCDTKIFHRQRLKAKHNFCSKKMRWRMDKQAKSELYLPNLWKEISRKAKQTCKNEAVGVLLARM